MKKHLVYRFDEQTQQYVLITDEAEAQAAAGKAVYYDREESVVAFVDELTGGLSAEAEAKLRALLRRKT